MLDRIFSGLQAQDVAKRTQLFFNDDGKMKFRKLPMINGAMVRKKGDQYIEGWEHHYKNQFPFEGYKNISADMVTISTARDVVFDPFSVIKPDEKPDKTGRIKQDYITARAKSAIYSAQKQKPKGLIMDKAMTMMTVVVGLLGFALFITLILRYTG